jgi:hypothetical protein
MIAMHWQITYHPQSGWFDEAPQRAGGCYSLKLELLIFQLFHDDLYDKF